MTAGSAIGIVGAIVAVVGVPAGAVVYLHEYVGESVLEVGTATRLERQIELTEYEIRDKEYQLELLYERAQTNRALPSDERRRRQLEADIIRLQNKLDHLKSLMVSQ